MDFSTTNQLHRDVCWQLVLLRTKHLSEHLKNRNDFTEPSPASDPERGRAQAAGAARATHSSARRPLVSQTGKERERMVGVGHTATTQRAKPSSALKLVGMRRATRRAHHQWKGDYEKHVPTDARDRATEDTEKPEGLEVSSALASLTRPFLRSLWLRMWNEVFITHRITE